MKIASSSLFVSSTFTVAISCLVAFLLLLSSSTSSNNYNNLVSARGFFYQIICQDSGCTADCQYTLFEEDVCYVMSNGYSGFGQCIDSRTVLVQQNYAFSNNCTGLYTDDELNSGECYPSGTSSNEYVKFSCNTAGSQNDEEKKKHQQQPPKLHHQKHNTVRKNVTASVLRFGKQAVKKN